MKKRYVYSLLFGIPGLLAAGILSILFFGAFAGILWIYVFGDNPWPASAETMISTLFVLVFLLLWMGFVFLGYVVGKGLEKDPALNRKHVLIAAGLTAMFLFLILFQGWSMGNPGPITESRLCSDFCVQHGYAVSGMPPKTSGDSTCICYDGHGNEAMRLPLDQNVPDAAK
jgi:hypothetical protein